MMNAFGKKLLLLVLALLFAGVVCEMGLRIIGQHDRDGNFYLRGKRIEPFRMPLASMQRALEKLSEKRANPHIVYHPHLGWAPAPNTVSSDGLYAFNSQTLRARSPSDDTPPNAPEGLRRILLIGDSFTLGGEVPYEQTWAHYLEADLQTRGIRVQVLNAGVGGYGMDQAFLRWESIGKQFSPDVLIFGMQLENCHRNVNLDRPVYMPNTGLPFSKPRFVATPDGWKKINAPALPPQSLPAILKDFSSWEWAGNEFFYNSRQYRVRPWHRSRLISVLLKILSGENEEGSFFFDPKEEPGQVTMGILEMLNDSAQAAGVPLLVVHLPIRSGIKNGLRTRPLEYQALLEEIRSRLDVVDPLDMLVESADETSLEELFMPANHYSQAANEIVGALLAEELLQRKLLP
jgi:hypothetical protein